MKNLKNLLSQINFRNDLPTIFCDCGIEVIAEIGVYRGINFRKLISSSCIKEAWAVDAWNIEIMRDALTVPSNRMDYYYQRMLILEMKDKRVRVLKNMSSAAAEYFATIGKQFDLIYIDADHTYDGCMKDLIAYYPLVKDGGVFCGHDYSYAYKDKRYKVAEAVDDFRKDKGSYFHVTKESAPSWFMIKE